MSACNMITVAEDLCGLLPAQTPVDPEKIKLFCSILSYMMHLLEKDTFPYRKEHTKGVRFLGGPGAWLEPGCSSTDEDWKIQGNGMFDPEAVTAVRYCLPCPSPPNRAVSGSCCRKKARAAFLPPCCACTAPASSHCFRLPRAQWREQSSASQGICFFPKVFITFHPINLFSFCCGTMGMD